MHPRGDFSAGEVFSRARMMEDEAIKSQAPSAHKSECIVIRSDNSKLPATRRGGCAARWFPQSNAVKESGMNKLTVNLTNCYGIKKLLYTFDFKQTRSYAIYASNGSMKTSLARTLKDYAEGKESGDLIFTSRASSRTVVDENSAPVNPGNIFVILPYDADSHLYENTSALLVNKDLRTEYQDINVELDQSKNSLLEALAKQSGSKRDLEKEISLTFTGAEDKFYSAISRIAQEALDQQDVPLSSVPYDVVFEKRVLDFLQDKDVKSTLEAYAREYDRLISQSTFFKKGIFEYYDASEIAKHLAKHGFFKAEHTVYLNGKKPVKVTTEKQLEKIIKEERDGITSDPELKKQFDKLEKQTYKNVAMQAFRDYYSANEGILPQILNVTNFRQEVWKAYLKSQSALLSDFMNKYTAVKKRKAEIEEQAGKEETQWDSVIDLFNERFAVPFTVVAKNKVSVMLDSRETPKIGFVFEDKESNVPVERSALMGVLSQGESRALYMLDILFEARRRQEDGQETLFVADDIADSFDYKNKYAIVEYLKEISERTTFRLLILTHNFDLFRTLENREVVNYPHCLMVSKSDSAVSLERASGIRNVFVRNWKKEFFTDSKKRVASIPFMRNLLEFMNDDSDPNYIKLTSLLHWKPDSASITNTELDAIYLALFGGSGAFAHPQKLVIDTIHESAVECLTAGDGINFENKIVLAIAIRLAADKFMVEKIADPASVAAISSCQTPRLLEKYEELVASKPEKTQNCKVLRRVVLMTPENIHLNSFMYEPILDMSDVHLRNLYRDVISLT